MELANRVALVTGAGAGIGRATALRLAAEGASAVVADVDAVAGAQVVKEIEAGGGRARFVEADVTREDGVRAAIDAAVRQGGLDLLVNNAGGVGEPNFPDAEPERWSRVIDLNLRAVMRATQLAVQQMRERGGGVVVNIASLAGIGFGPHAAPEYAASKAAVARLTGALAPLRERCGVRVNCVCPSWVDTPTSRRTLAGLTEAQRRGVPRVMLRAEQIADAVVHFARDESLAGRVMIWPDQQPWRLLDPHGFP